MRGFALVFFALTCCSRRETRPVAVDAASGPASRGAVNAYCGAGPCRDYPTAVAHVRRLSTPGQGPGCSDASIGRCGAARYVHFSDGFGAFEEYFDSSGAMISAYTRADIDPAGGWYGTSQSCEKVPDVVLCRGGYLDAGASGAPRAAPSNMPSSIPSGSGDYAESLALAKRYKKGELTFDQLKATVVARKLAVHPQGDAYLMIPVPMPPPGTTFNPRMMPKDWEGTFGEVAMAFWLGELTRDEYNRLHAAAHPSCPK